jgi:hypothetical protein
MDCQHLNFSAIVDVHRLLDDADQSKVVGYASEIKINCADCGLPFVFKGLPAGVSITNSNAMVSMDGKELRAPLKPSADAVDQVKSILND